MTATSAVTSTARRFARLAAALGTVCTATVLALPATAATTPSPTPSATLPGGVRPARVVDRVVRDDRVAEASGLVRSRTLDGVLWTFNDSGNTPDLFGIGRSGDVVARVRVTDADNDDWEAAAPVRLLDGVPAIAIGDIGDNKAERDHVSIHVVAEPAKAGTTKRRAERVVTLTYPDRPADAEALFADPRTNRLYVVTKGLLGGRLYAVPQEVWPGGRRTGRSGSATLEYLARVPLVLVTDAVGLPDGRVALRTYGELAMMPPVPAAAGDDEVWSPLATTTLPRQGQGESIALVRSRDAFLLGTEGRRKPILRFTPPADVMAARPPPAAVTPSAAASASAGATAAPADGSDAGSGGASTAVFLAGGAGLVGAVAVGALVSARRRR